MTADQRLVVEMIFDRARRIDADTRFHAAKVHPRVLLIGLAREADAMWTTLFPFPYRLGWGKALDMFMDSNALEFDVPFVISNATLVQVSRGLLHNINFSAYLEFIAEAVHTGLLQAENASDTHIGLSPTTKAYIERHDRRGFDWLERSAADKLGDLDQAIDTATPAIANFVDLFRGTHITYLECPAEIEDLFGRWANAYLQSRMGGSSFRADSRFGSIEFDTYRKAAFMIVASARKHAAFHRAAHMRYPDLDPFNTLTVSADISTLLEEFSVFLDCSDIEARTIVEVFTRNPSRPPSLNHPPYIRIGENCVLRSITGALDNIYFYMLESLRLLYPSDWDKAVDVREGIFRDDIAQQFIGWGVTTLPHSCKINTPLGKTDIDAIALDSKTGTLALFQLKWMDPYGTSLRLRRTKQDNFVSKANDWVRKVDSWLKKSPPTDVAKNLGFSRKQAKSVKAARMFVVGRWYSLFATGQAPDPRSAWISWGNLVKSLNDLSSFTNLGLSFPGALEWLWQDATIGNKVLPPQREHPDGSEIIEAGELQIEIRY